ncbi:MAG: PASTA domain-containing protein [Chloroflexota bacterium]
MTIPDVSGMNVPQAAAALNKNGLRLGVENNQGWTADSGLPENTINGQSIPAGQTAPFGTSVDVNVLRSPNALVIYDDNDLTLVNNSGGDLNLAGITFAAANGNGAQLAGSRWATSLRNGQCTQVWSVGRNGPKGLDECSDIQNWLVTTNAGEHFWTGEGGTTQFTVLQNGVPRATCPVANPGRCEFYLSSGGSSSDATDYVYFAYTLDRLAIINQSTDKWMTLDGFYVINNFAPNKGATVFLGDPTLFTSRQHPPDVETVTRLAPGQCILYTNQSPDADSPPQPCEVIARLDIGATLIFWGADFGIASSDSEQRTCPAPTAGRLTICVMPR